MNWKSFLAVSLFLFVCATLISQSAMDGFAIFSILFVTGYWFQQRKSFPILPKLGIEKQFLFFAVAVIFSFAVNWNTESLAVFRIVELKWILNFYFLIAAMRLFQPDWKTFSRLQCVIAFTCAFALLSPILGYDLLRGMSAIIDRTPSGVARVGGFFSDPMTFAHLHALYFFLLLGMCLKFFEAKNRSRFATLALTGLVGASLLLSFTRGVWAGMFVGLVLTGFIFNKRRGFWILISSVGLALAAFFLIPSIHERVLQFQSAASYDGERWWIWKANWQIFLDHPIFGIGYGENALVLQSYYDKMGAPAGLLVSHSHNQYLNFLSGTGLFGLAAYLWLVFSMFSQTWKTYLEQRDKAPLWIQGLLLGSLGAQISFAVGGVTESNFEHSKVRYALMLVWALAFWFRTVKFSKKFRDEEVQGV